MPPPNESHHMPAEVITHINPDSMLKNPAFSQAVMVEDAKKFVYIGEQNGVDASGVVVGDDLKSQTEHALRIFWRC
jgi:enamine deaminase RidA (YjgF/YER057c/UK114 family)